MEPPQVVRVLKRDALGSIELVMHQGAQAIRRVASGGRLPLSRAIARILLARERRALRRLEGLAGVARVLEEAPDGGSILRSFVPGMPLCLATELPRDFFERLEELVHELHRCGVCHNDLHKAANVLVGEDGYPALVDFQLASLHSRRGRVFASRVREDLRHVWKHRAFYYRAMGGAELSELPALPRRSFVAEAWRRFGKPVYRQVTRSAKLRLALESGEPRRAKEGPWPRWVAPVGRR